MIWQVTLFYIKLANSMRWITFAFVSLWNFDQLTIVVVCVFNHPLQSQENKERKVNMSFCELKYAWITNNDAIIIASWNLLCSCVGDIAPDSSVSSSHSFENHAAINERNRLNAFNLFLKFYLKKKKKREKGKYWKIFRNVWRN